MRIKRKDLRARAYSVNDAQSDRRETVINGRRLPYQERIRLKKLAQRTKARSLRQIRRLKIATLNVGSMTGKSIELVKMMEKRGMNIMCVLETKWKGAKAKEIGDGYKLFYSGVHNKRNGVGVILDKELKENVIGVKRVSDRVMSLRVLIGKEVCKIVSAYAPQVGCDEEEKEAFWEEMTQVMQGREKIWIGGDLNGHVGLGNKGNEECMGNCGMGIRNEEGERIISFAKAESLAIVNTYFKKEMNKLITYSSGQHKTQIDYLMCRKSDLKSVKDCKVIPGDYVAKQHRPVVAIVSWMQKKISSMSTEKKTKWWNLKIEEKKEAFYLEMKEHLKKQIEANWSETSKFMRECAERLLGVTSGKVMVEKEN